MGSKYIFKPDQNPPVGAYEADSAKLKILSPRKDTYSYISKPPDSPKK